MRGGVRPEDRLVFTSGFHKQNTNSQNALLEEAGMTREAGTADSADQVEYDT